MYHYWSRWGLFWKSLEMDIAQSGQIISAAALVHNFTIDSREGVDEDTLDMFDEEAYFQQFSTNTVAELDDSLFEGTNSTRPIIMIIIIMKLIEKQMLMATIMIVIIMIFKLI
jgi:hypothetical protein